MFCQQAGNDYRPVDLQRLMVDLPKFQDHASHPGYPGDARDDHKTIAISQRCLFHLLAMDVAFV
jgi:hypothetical protein